MSLETEILDQIDTAQLAEQLGTDPDTARRSASDAIRALVGGMQTNAQSPTGEASLATALSQHAGSSLLEGTLDLDQVDQNDGAAIVSHVLGNPAEAAQFGGLQAAGGGDQALMNKVVKLLAPIVMAYIAKRITEGQGDVLGQARQGQGGGILGDILGQVLGGAGHDQPAEQSQPPQDGGILGQILGGIFRR